MKELLTAEEARKITNIVMDRDKMLFSISQKIKEAAREGLCEIFIYRNHLDNEEKIKQGCIVYESTEASQGLIYETFRELQYHVAGGNTYISIKW